MKYLSESRQLRSLSRFTFEITRGTRSARQAAETLRPFDSCEVLIIRMQRGNLTYAGALAGYRNDYRRSPDL